MKVVVLGGGPAGLNAAVRARELGAEVTLIERKRLGGTSLNEGAAPVRTLARAARLLRENTPAAAGEYRNPRRDVPFALLMMILIVTLVYSAVQLVALGTLPELARSSSPLAEAAGRFAGRWGAWLLTAGAMLSIIGNAGNTTLIGRAICSRSPPTATVHGGLRACTPSTARPQTRSWHRRRSCSRWRFPARSSGSRRSR